MEDLPPSRLSVAIHFQHSSQYLSDQYPPSICDFLESTAQSNLNPGPSEPSTQNCAVLALPRTYPSNTPLATIRHDIETQFPHVPIHPKSRFRQRLSEVWSKPEEFDDGQTVGHAWQTIRAAEERAEAQQRQWAEVGSGSSGWPSSAFEDDEDGGVRSKWKEEREKDDVAVVNEHMSGAEPVEGSAAHGSAEEAEGEIHLVVATTAGYLAEIDKALPWDFRLWRRYAVSLNYLMRKKGTNFDDPSEADAELDNEIAKFESLEREGGEELRRKLAVWEEIVCGVADADGTEMGSRGEREAEIEARMQKWNNTKRESATAAADSTTSATTTERIVTTFDQDTWEPRDPEEDLLFPAIPPASAARIVAVPLPTDHDAGAEPYRDASFTVRSGAVLWGQLHTVFAGSASASFDGKVPPPALSGGTILQHVLNYRAAARNGRWRVRRAYSNTGMQDDYAEPVQHFGYVAHHESIDPMEVLWRCAGKDWGPRQGYDILNIGRYDWSWICEPGDPSRLQDFVHKATGLRVVDEPQDFVSSDLLALRPRWGGFCMLLDAEEFGEEFLQAFVRDCPARRGLDLGAGEANERLFIRKREGNERDGDAIGAWMACGMTEYEFGWLIFSGKNHDVHTEADELLAIVYDGTYDQLEGTRFSVGN